MNIVTMVSASSLLYEHCDLRAISTRRMSSQRHAYNCTNIVI
ncbi:hypothetical protein [Wolbachia pipientis]|nr:hypothetical protein [Wolbachia pipientis]